MNDGVSWDIADTFLNSVKEVSSILLCVYLGANGFDNGDVGD